MRTTFVEELIASYPKARPWIALFLVAAVTTAPAIPSQSYRIGVTALLSVTLLYLVFDIYKELSSRLSNIEKRLKNPDPIHYKSFTDALPDIEEELLDRLNANRNVKIRMLAVTAQYSWKNLIEDKTEYLVDIGNRKQKIEIELAIVLPSIMKDWKQAKLMADAERTIHGIDIYRQKWHSLFESGRISLKVYKYDNIPHWHGLLIDEDVVYFGRTRWAIRGDSMELTIGTNPYRKFSKNDVHKGNERIILFTNWFEAYKLRGDSTASEALE